MSLSAASFSPIVNTDTSKVTFDPLKTPAKLSSELPRYLLERGFFTSGRLAGLAYQIVIAHPEDAEDMYQTSEAELESERILGIQNLKPRKKHEIRENLSIDLMAQPESGGAAVLLVLEKDNSLLAMGGVALVDKPETAGRGDMFSKCDLDKQIVMNMAVTHPAYQGEGLTSKIFYHRLKIATLFSAEFECAKPREYVITKVAGMGTKNFYANTLGFVPDGKDLVLTDAKAPDNLLTTLGMTMSEVCHKVKTARPDIYNNGLTLKDLHENNRKSSFALHAVS